MNFTDSAIKLIKDFEGFVAKPYTCPAGKNTIGYGHVIRDKELFAEINEEQATALLRQDLRWVVKTIENTVAPDLMQNEYDALCSFIFNIGGTAFRKSRMLVLLNSENFLDAADEFPRWCHIGKEVSPGLVRRRKAERELFMKD